MKLIVGLGNPDEKYRNTKHNTGFMAIDCFAEANSLTFKMQKSFQGETALGRGFVLLKPTTYMNLSGNAVQSVARYYHIESEDILIISDDFNLPLSKIRIREKGSAGGHNGLKSIIQCLGTEEFPRVRIGIGDPGDDSIDYVLGAFSKIELEALKETFKTTNNVIKDFIDGKSIYELQNLYN